MKNALAAEELAESTSVGETPGSMLRSVEFVGMPSLDVGEAPGFVLDPERSFEYPSPLSLEPAQASAQQVGMVLKPVSVQVHQNNYFYFGGSRVRPTEELRVVQSELETAIRKLTYEDGDDEGFLPSTRSRRQAQGFASAHATAHVLRRTNEALRALTNAVHVLHTIEKKKYAV